MLPRHLKLPGWLRLCGGILAAGLIGCSGAIGLAQETPAAVEKLDGRAGRPLLLENFRPQSQLKVAQHLLTRAKFPVIDIHSHWFIRLKHSAEQRDAYLQVMQRNNIALSISLDGTLGDRLTEHQAFLGKNSDAKRHTAIFANLDWQGEGKPAGATG